MLIIIILFTDWFDGATARKHGFATKEGYLIDVVIDRYSEVLIFLGDSPHPVALLFLAAAAVNIALSFYSFRTGHHTSMALRFFYLFPLIFGWVS